MSRFARRGALLALAIVVIVLPTPAKARAEKPRDLAAVVAPVRLIPRGPEPLRVSGLHAYYGRIDLDSAGDGIVVVNHLPLEDYLLGLNEVPFDWPMEALKAQAVAARTYALWTLARPPGGDAQTYGFDICASIECQVFTGAALESDEDGDRWVEAVRATEGRTVLYTGEPILARYSSTTGGRTLDNSEAFPDERDYPYLRSVPSTTEKAAPLWRWNTAFALGDLEAILERVGLWSAGRLTRVESVPSREGYHYPDIVFVGTNGRLRRTAEEVREVLRELAPVMFPSRYPSFALTGTGRLPEVWPSNRVTVRTQRRTVEVVGRGWGHGVGLSQWGAYGLARRGADYVDILTHYYTGVEIGEVEDPGALDVGVDWGRLEVTVTGAFDIIDGRGRTLVRNALGDWAFRWARSGAVAIEPPRGYGLPLRVGVVDAPDEVVAGRRATVTVALSRPARVVATGGGRRASKVLPAGRGRISWTAPAEPGRYELVIEATAGRREPRGESLEIVVTAAAGASNRSTGRAGGSEEGFPWWTAVSAIALAAGLVIAGSRLERWRKRRWSRTG